MNKLPNDIQCVIYTYEHYIMFKLVMDYLITKRVRCKFNISRDVVGYLIYRDHTGKLKSCLNEDNMYVSPSELLNQVLLDYREVL